MQFFRSLPLLIASLALAPFITSCASQQYKAVADEREADNRALREERARIKGENRDLAAEKASLEVALAEANARLLEQPERGAGQNYAELDELGVGYGMRDGRMVISIPTEISFASGRSELSAGGKRALKSVANTLKKDYPTGEFEYWIEGHTDSDPISKSKFASNRDLSLARAMAVLRSLVDDCDIPDNTCVVTGWGPHRPVASNSSASNKAKNRRVEIVVEKAGGTPIKQ
jgi:chemotaxis protein MotB